MSRRNRSSRRRTYGKRQHEVRERRFPDLPRGDWLTSGEGWAGRDHADDALRSEADADAWRDYLR